MSMKIMDTRHIVEGLKGRIKSEATARERKDIKNYNERLRRAENRLRDEGKDFQADMLVNARMSALRFHLLIQEPESNAFYKAKTKEERRAMLIDMMTNAKSEDFLTMEANTEERQIPKFITESYMKTFKELAKDSQESERAKHKMRQHLRGTTFIDYKESFNPDTAYSLENVGSKKKILSRIEFAQYRPMGETNVGSKVNTKLKEWAIDETVRDKLYRMNFLEAIDNAWGSVIKKGNINQMYVEKLKAYINNMSGAQLSLVYQEQPSLFSISEMYESISDNEEYLFKKGYVKTPITRSIEKILNRWEKYGTEYLTGEQKENLKTELEMIDKRY